MLVSTALPDSDWPHLVKLDHEIKSKLLGVHHIMGKSSSQSSLHMHHVAQFTLYNVMYIRMFHLARYENYMMDITAWIMDKPVTVSHALSLELDIIGRIVPTKLCFQGIAAIA